jgi:hypothetical protein
MNSRYSAGFMAMIFASIIMCFAFRSYWNSPVKGSVTPSNAGTRAWVFSATDTANASILEGNFMIENVKPGIYTLMVEGVPPYRNSIKAGVTVADGQSTDVGVIQMNK